MITTFDNGWMKMESENESAPVKLVTVDLDKLIAQSEAEGYAISVLWDGEELFSDEA
jgi:hypothetical protein